MKRVALILGLGCALALSLAVSAQQPESDGPRFTSGTTLARPADYREWVFLASGLGMTYNPPGAASTRPPSFTNVFVNPSSYRAFMQTGTWPDKTALVLEIRGSDSEASINKSGRFQTQQVLGLEIHVKDSRLPGGWGFFNFGGDVSSAPPMAGDRVKGCVECHAANAAVDTTFVQFYPTLIDIARQKGTLRAGF